MGEKTKLKNVSDHETNQFWRMVAIGAIILILFLSLPPLCSADCGHSHDSPDHHHHHHDHDHDHGHHHHHEEPASFKWSKQANEVYEEEEVHSHHDHHHDHHDHHDHDHHHDEHAHSHEQKPKNVPGKL